MKKSNSGVIDWYLKIPLIKRALIQIAIGIVGLALTIYCAQAFGPSAYDAPRDMIGAAVPILPLVIGLAELIFRKPLIDLAEKWDQLKGWQRGIIGLLAVVLAATLAMALLIGAGLLGLI